MQDDVIKRGGAGGGERFGHATGRQSAFAFNNVNARRVLAVNIRRGPGQAERGRQSDTGRAGRQPNEWCRRRGMTIERFGVEFFEQRRLGRRIAAEAEQIFQPELELLSEGSSSGAAMRAISLRKAHMA